MRKDVKFDSPNRWGSCFLCKREPMDRRFMFEISYDDEVIGDLCEDCFHRFHRFGFVGHDDEPEPMTWEHREFMRESNIPYNGWWLTEDVPEPGTTDWNKFITEDYHNKSGLWMGLRERRTIESGLFSFGID